MERRGIETEVGKRIEREALEAAQRRLERAAELGKVERETRELTGSIIDVSGNLEAAKRERDLMLKGQAELTRERAPSLEELQRQGRERWLAMRAEQRAKENTPEQGPDKTIEKTPQPTRSIEEERQLVVDRWREYRRNQELGQGREAAPERQGPEKDLERGKERDGPELE